MTRRGPRAVRRPSGDAGALSAAIARDDWERAALLLLIALLEVARAMPAGDIDDVLALLSAEEDGDA